MSAEPTPAPDHRSGLEASLGAAGFRRGEPFELMRITDDPKFPRQPWHGLDMAAAARWIEANPRDVYLILNPRKVDSKARFSKAVDMALARTLYIDLDPDWGDRAGAARLARDVQAFLAMKLGEGVCSVVDSGRGRALWLAHEAMPVEMSHDTRKLFLEGLAWRFRDVVPGGKLDHSPFAACAASRVAGSVNGKTGEVVRVLAQATGRVAWSRLSALTEELAKDLPPPTEGPRKLPPEFHEAIKALGDSIADHRDELQEQAWSWMGKVAGKRGVHDLCADGIPPRWRAAFRSAAAEPHRKYARPDGEALRKQVERAFDAVAARSARAAAHSNLMSEVEVLGITRRTDGSGRGGRLDLELRVGEARFVLRGVDGRTVKNYPLLANRAAEEGAWLPSMKDAAEAWSQIIGPAWAAQKVVVEDVSMFRAVRDTIRTVMRTREVGKSALDLERGLRVEVDGGLAIKGTTIIERVRDAMKNDLVDRGDVADAARDLGGDLGARVTVIDTKTGQTARVRAWLFPSTVVQLGDE